MKHRHSSQSVKNFFLTFFISYLLFCLSSCAKQSQRSTSLISQKESETKTNGKQVNINTATQKELETLPAIGEEMAARIIEHRRSYGGFRRAEHLLLVRGMSDNKFRKLREFVTVDVIEK